MNELKPCPFCGRNTTHVDRYQCDDEWWAYVECIECMAIGPIAKLKQQAIDAWNRREGEKE